VQVHALALRHGDYLRRLARRLCRTQLDPDDLVQDVLERLLRVSIPPLVDERPWLARVTYHLFVDQLRRPRLRCEELTDELAVCRAAHDDPPRWWERLSEDDVRGALAELPAEQRMTFELFAFEGKTYDEIAAALGIAKSTVGTRILRARQKLRVAITARHRRE